MCLRPCWDGYRHWQQAAGMAHGRTQNVRMSADTPHAHVTKCPTLLHTLHLSSQPWGGGGGLEYARRGSGCDSGQLAASAARFPACCMLGSAGKQQATRNRERQPAISRMVAMPVSDNHAHRSRTPQYGRVPKAMLPHKRVQKLGQLAVGHDQPQSPKTGPVLSAVEAHAVQPAWNCS